MSDLLKRLIKEFDHEDTEDWKDEEIGEFARSSGKIGSGISGLMVLGYFICLSDEERDAAWAKFQLEKES